MFITRCITRPHGLQAPAFPTISETLDPPITSYHISHVFQQVTSTYAYHVLSPSHLPSRTSAIVQPHFHFSVHFALSNAFCIYLHINYLTNPLTLELCQPPHLLLLPADREAFRTKILPINVYNFQTLSNLSDPTSTAHADAILAMS
jgi:hypothetical protein